MPAAQARGGCAKEVTTDIELIQNIGSFTRLNNTAVRLVKNRERLVRIIRSHQTLNRKSDFTQDTDHLFFVFELTEEDDIERKSLLLNAVFNQFPNIPGTPHMKVNTIALIF